jgi:hypothetical protein
MILLGLRISTTLLHLKDSIYIYLLKRRQISEAILLCKMVTKYIGTETCLSSRAKEVPGGHTELTHHFTRGKREKDLILKVYIQQP